MATADFGAVGLAVMGRNLALNVESRGYTWLHGCGIQPFKRSY